MGISAEAQQRLSNNILDITLPKGSEKISKQELRAIVRPKNRSPLNRERLVGDHYKISQTLIQIYAVNANTPKNQIDENKKGFDEIYRNNRPNYYKSTVRSINNFRVLVIQCEDKNADIGYFILNLINNANTSAASIGIEYKQSDGEAAAKAVEELLNNTKFKK
jgi:hypothetical protein